MKNEIINEVEGLRNDIRTHIDLHEERELGEMRGRYEEMKKDQDRLEKKVDDLCRLVEKKFTIAETLFKVVRFTGIAIIAILTLKFGDIKEWFQYLFK